MNCPKCNGSVDYRFSTVCAHCQAELSCVDPGAMPPLVPVVLDTQTPGVGLPRKVANAVLIVLTAGMCTLGGGTFMYAFCAVFGILHRTFFYDPAGPHSCGDGLAFLVLSVLTGGFLGCITGTLVSYKSCMFRVKTDV